MRNDAQLRTGPCIINEKIRLHNQDLANKAEDEREASIPSSFFLISTRRNDEGYNSALQTRDE